MFTVVAAEAVPARGTMKAADVTAVAIAIIRAALPVLIRMAMRFWFLSSPQAGNPCRVCPHALRMPHSGHTAPRQYKVESKVAPGFHFRFANPSRGDH